MWQDYVIAAGQWIFTLALLPSIFGKNKPETWTSGLTFFFLLIFSVTFFTLNLNYSGVADAVNAFAWFVLFMQKAEEKENIEKLDED